MIIIIDLQAPHLRKLRKGFSTLARQRKPNNPSDGDKEKFKLFVETARKLGCDEDPAHFDEILKKVARHKPPLHLRPEPKKPKTR